MAALDNRLTPGPGKGPILTAGGTRTVPIVGNPVCTGVSANATGITGNLTVTGIVCGNLGALVLSAGGSSSVDTTLNYDATVGVLTPNP